MKRVLFIMSLVFAAALVHAQSITVRSETADNTDFGKFKTFSWASQVSNELDPGLYFLNDLVLKAQVREAVKAELMGRGYNESETDGDMVVNFRVFDKATTLKDMQAYGSDYWGDTSYGMIDNDAANVAVDAGTLLVSLADRKDGKVVWQGFASGLINNDQFVKDEVKIREAVKMIFDDYNHTVKDYTRR
jgi:hypothetical protein